MQYECIDINCAEERCVHCLNENYTSDVCEKVTIFQELKKVLMRLAKCFNCLNSGHRVVNCGAKSGSKNYTDKHHVSICSRALIKQQATDTAPP